MSFVDCLDSPGGLLVSSGLGPWSWTTLRSAAPCMSAVLSESVLRHALVSALEQKTAFVAQPHVSMEERFSAVEVALRLATAGRVCGDVAQGELARLLDLLLSWFGAYRPRDAMSHAETARVHKEARRLLRGTDPRLWTAAARACPSLYPQLNSVISKWPCSMQDRDVLLESGAAVLPSLADPSDLDQALAAMALGVRLSCGSVRRVALLEEHGLSAMILRALQLHGEDDDILVRALAYFNNMLNCDEQRPVVAALPISAICQDAICRLGGHAEVQDLAENILDMLEVT